MIGMNGIEGEEEGVFDVDGCGWLVLRERCWERC